MAQIFILTAILARLDRIWEENVTISDRPSPLPGKLDDVALRIEEEERLGRADGEAGVGAFAATGDFGADLILKNLEKKEKGGE